MSSNVRANPPGTTHQSCPFGGSGTIVHSWADGHGTAFCTLAHAVQGSTLTIRESALRDSGCPRWKLTQNIVFPVPLATSALACKYADGESHRSS